MDSDNTFHDNLYITLCDFDVSGGSLTNSIGEYWGMSGNIGEYKGLGYREYRWEKEPGRREAEGLARVFRREKAWQLRVPSRHAINDKLNVAVAGSVGGVGRAPAAH